MECSTKWWTSATPYSVCSIAINFCVIFYSSNVKKLLVLDGWTSKMNLLDFNACNYSLTICVLSSIFIGHQWLLNTLGVKPKSSWSVDPFGHGSAFPYVLKASGVDGTYEASFRFSELLLFVQHILSTYIICKIPLGFDRLQI